LTEATRIVGGGESRLDVDRSRRIGIPEAVYAQGKSTEQCVRIVSALLQRNRDPIIVTRTNQEQREALAELGPMLVASNTLTWNHWPNRDVHPVGILSGGTSDQPVVDECRAALEAMGIPVEVHNDVGVAGIHRLIEVLPGVKNVSVVVAVAGMEASLPTILGGLISVPLIGVPTSAGYGSSFEGITALLSMLSSCAPGVSVVGIDNGYGAACAAARILGAR
jgi:NCAIR mutase (PurE)-related protein